MMGWWWPNNATKKGITEVLSPNSTPSTAVQMSLTFTAANRDKTTPAMQKITLRQREEHKPGVSVGKRLFLRCFIVF
jgi:hypothetical protein